MHVRTYVHLQPHERKVRKKMIFDSIAAEKAAIEAAEEAALAIEAELTREMAPLLQQNGNAETPAESINTLPAPTPTPTPAPIEFRP